MTRLEQLLDSEERNSQLLGALDALEDLVTNRAHGVDIRAEPLAYLLRLINQSARGAGTARQHRGDA